MQQQGTSPDPIEPDGLLVPLCKMCMHGNQEERGMNHIFRRLQWLCEFSFHTIAESYHIIHIMSFYPNRRIPARK